MRYLYKQTGIVVESDITLDSAMFRPVDEPEVVEEAEVKAEPEVKPKAAPTAKAKKIARKTATAKK